MVCCVFLKNGLGDQILDVIGAYVIAKIHKESLMIHWKENPQNFSFGNAVYAKDLFEIEHIEHVVNLNSKPEYLIVIPYPSASTAPCFIFEKYKDIIDINTIKELYSNVSNIFKPCIEIHEHLSVEIDYGIHLRCSDKIIYDSNHKSGIDCNIDEYTSLMIKLKAYVHDIIQDNCSFYVCCEDDNVEIQFKNWLLDTANKKNKKIHIIHKTHIPSISTKEGYDAVYDLFMLSKCKALISGTKYSTFGILACMLSYNKKYICFVDDIHTTLLFAWLICFNTIINNNVTLPNIVYQFPSQFNLSSFYKDGDVYIHKVVS